MLQRSSAHHADGKIMRTVLGLSVQTLTAAMMTVVIFAGSLQLSDAVPAEGLTPFGFLMARAYGEPVAHPVMRFIAFKPSDGAKFRETFEKKHGPKGRDLIDSLGRGSYRTATAVAASAEDQNATLQLEQIAVDEASSAKPFKNPSEYYHDWSKRQSEQNTKSKI